MDTHFTRANTLLARVIFFLARVNLFSHVQTRISHMWKRVVLPAVGHALDGPVVGRGVRVPDGLPPHFHEIACGGVAPRGDDVDFEFQSQTVGVCGNQAEGRGGESKDPGRVPAHGGQARAIEAADDVVEALG